MGLAGPLIAIGAIFLVVLLILVFANGNGFDQVSGSSPSDSSTDASGSGGASIDSSGGGGNSDSSTQTPAANSKAKAKANRRGRRGKKEDNSGKETNGLSEVDRAAEKRRRQRRQRQTLTKAVHENTLENFRIEMNRRRNAISKIPDMLENRKEEADKIQQFVETEEAKEKAQPSLVQDTYGPFQWWKSSSK